MKKEVNEKSIVEKAKEIEKEIYKLTEKTSLKWKGIGILRKGIRKTTVVAVFNITQGVSESENKSCLMYFQKSLSQLKALNYYNFISRKIGYFSHSQHLRLKKMIKDITEGLSLEDLNHHGSDGFSATSMKIESQTGFSKEGRAELRFSSRNSDNEGEKPLIS